MCPHGYMPYMPRCLSTCLRVYVPLSFMCLHACMLFLFYVPACLCALVFYVPMCLFILCAYILSVFVLRACVRSWLCFYVPTCLCTFLFQVLTCVCAFVFSVPICLCALYVFYMPACQRTLASMCPCLLCVYVLACLF